jgi:hypothetical protein
MRRLVVPVVLALAFTFVPYVRRAIPGRSSTPVLVVGSRDRTLHGKARRRARHAHQTLRGRSS